MPDRWEREAEETIVLKRRGKIVGRIELGTNQWTMWNPRLSSTPEKYPSGDASGIEASLSEAKRAVEEELELNA
ncbi:hypothetical protein LCGC14_0840160 [marine sediment metagenome]|uniref:Uncharacterized protein n=1 Tax=marine sediment metagenome TaxID=412755 RepID=A0A0F9SKT4_9ZZZZ